MAKRGEGMDNEDTLEFDLDEEEAVHASKLLAIAVFYSRKSYNPQSIFFRYGFSMGDTKVGQSGEDR
jgi:hypothetical protein